MVDIKDLIKLDEIGRLDHEKLEQLKKETETMSYKAYYRACDGQLEPLAVNLSHCEAERLRDELRDFDIVFQDEAPTDAADDPSLVFSASVVIGSIILGGAGLILALLFQ